MVSGNKKFEIEIINGKLYKHFLNVYLYEQSYESLKYLNINCDNEMYIMLNIGPLCPMSRQALLGLFQDSTTFHQ